MIVMYIYAGGALMTRFLLNKMDSFEGAASVVMGQAVMELVLRQTITERDRFTYMYILRHSKKEADARFGHPSYGRHRARVVLAEMVVEYGCIVLAPVLYLVFEPFRLFYNFGYTPGEPVAVDMLLGGFALQLAAEFVVDILCVRSEENAGIPVSLEWRRTRKHGHRRYIYLGAVGLAVANAFVGITAAFHFKMPAECLPFPCDQCTAEGAGREFLSGAGTAAEWLHYCENVFNATNT